jgi:hypothetical protein
MAGREAVAAAGTAVEMAFAIAGGSDVARAVVAAEDTSHKSALDVC